MTKRFHLKTKYVDAPEAEARVEKYLDGSPALVLYAQDPEFGEWEVYTKASVNLSGQGDTPQPGHLFIKDYSENTGVLACLIENGIVGKPVREVPAGHASAHECPLLIGGDEDGSA